MSRPVRFDPLSVCPYAAYADLRRHAPVHRVPGAGYFVVSRLADVRAVARDPERFSSRLTPASGRTDAAARVRNVERLPAAAGVLSRFVRDTASGGAERPAVLGSADPPEHTRHRQIATRALGIRPVAETEARVRSITGELLDGFRGERHVEWMGRFATQLPLRVTADLLGFPAEDLPGLGRWTAHAVAAVGGAMTAAEIHAHARAWADLERYVEARLTAGGTGVVAEIGRAVGSGSEALSRPEAVSLIIQLLLGGNESTSSLLGSAAWLLAEHPSIVEQLRADPASIPAFVEEALRLESPFRGHFRVATRDSELAGVPIPAGARVMLLWGSANRDEQGFARPDDIDLQRANPKNHVAFGDGIHYCVGASLARLQARIALEAFLATFASVRLTPGHQPTHLRSLIIRRPTTLDLDLGGRSKNAGVPVTIT